MEAINNPNIVIEQQKESIKIEKNTKGYNWEIRILPRAECLLPSDKARLDELNKMMLETYGGLIN